MLFISTSQIIDYNIIEIHLFGGLMNVSVSQPNLAQALSIVSHAVSSRSTMTILENVLISTEEDCICLSATNLELGLRYWIPAQIEQPGAVTLPAKMFTDLVNTMPADTVNLKIILLKSVQVQYMLLRKYTLKIPNS